MKEPKRAKMVEVTWLDACSHLGYYYKDEEFFLTQYSVGFLVKDDEDGIVLAISCAPKANNPYKTCIEIPRGMVKKVRKLQ